MEGTESLSFFSRRNSFLKNFRTSDSGHVHMIYCNPSNDKYTAIKTLPAACAKKRKSEIYITRCRFFEFFLKKKERKNFRRATHSKKERRALSAPTQNRHRRPSDDANMFFFFSPLWFDYFLAASAAAAAAAASTSASTTGPSLLVSN